MNFKAAMVGSNIASSEATSGTTSLEGLSQPILVVSITEISLQIAINRLHGKNYLEWSQFVHLMIDGKGKLRYLNSEVKPAANIDPKYNQWRLENSMVIVWRSTPWTRLWVNPSCIYQ